MTITLSFIAEILALCGKKNMISRISLVDYSGVVRLEYFLSLTQLIDIVLSQEFLVYLAIINTCEPICSQNAPE